jgi:hypothetical protein
MRRSKIKRQEEKRSRERSVTQRAKQSGQRHADAWTVVHEDDVSEMKYGLNWKPDWFDEDHARTLAEPAHPSHRWVAVSVDDLAQFGGPGVSHKEMLSRKAASPKDDEGADL